MVSEYYFELSFIYYIIMYNLFYLTSEVFYYFLYLDDNGVQQKKSISLDEYKKMKLKNKNNQEDLFNKPIDELVNFIEGNKAINEKRAAKKARRREKKVYICL